MGLEVCGWYFAWVLVVSRMQNRRGDRMNVTNKDPFPIPRITSLAESPELALQSFPEPEMFYRLTASALQMALTKCADKGAVVDDGVLYIQFCLELQAWLILASFETMVLRRHIKTICIDDRPKRPNPYSAEWAVAFGDVVLRSEGVTT
jgi:hypothetical protein